MRKQAKNGSGTWPGDAMSWEADWDLNLVHLAQEFLNFTINLHSPALDIRVPMFGKTAYPTLQAKVDDNFI